MTGPVFDVTDAAVAQMKAARALRAAIDAEKARAAAEGRGWLIPGRWDAERRAHAQALAAFEAACAAANLHPDDGDGGQIGLFE